jgi:hypothetical protein
MRDPRQRKSPVQKPAAVTTLLIVAAGIIAMAALILYAASSGGNCPPQKHPVANAYLNGKPVYECESQ